MAMTSEPRRCLRPVQDRMVAARHAARPDRLIVTIAMAALTHRHHGPWRRSS